ncbi:hypothetical protein Rsub_10921 [Raphidocelis subcapitata]|uniref:C3H1-type domain-containing protein n=1 Tax=Raphidocelis subcapitata TaxID=307507 RepID=A0A2V0PEI3_9CHLO|nr:hypothetical protein Rsub_10921 [Raphidocelis subcapitata]|eukprot:GBF98258.1 hypothetical protein Rsub_10921 [Raphidocelis subcapitata]
MAENEGAAAQAGGLSDNIRAEGFDSDESMMFRFKVETCPKEAAHDWLECPFAHSGEKAARRDPRTHTHMAVICPDIRRSGRCPRGEGCSYAHSVFELHLHPSRYRTQLCTMGGNCTRPVCFFAHNQEELRPAPPAPEGEVAGMAAAAAAAAAARRASGSPPLPPPAPLRGLSFDLSADAGAAAAAAMRAAMARPPPGRSSLDTAAAAGYGNPTFGALAAMRAPLMAPESARGRASLDLAPPPPRRAPAAPGRASVDAFAGPPRGQRRASLPALLPAELGFAAPDDLCFGAGGSASESPGPYSGSTLMGSGGSGCASLFGSASLGSLYSASSIYAGAGAGAAPAAAPPAAASPWLPPGAAPHSQQVRAAIALLEGGGSPPRRGTGRRAAFDAGSRPHAAFDAERQRLLSALFVQQQAEQLAATQCEQLAARRREEINACRRNEIAAAAAAFEAQHHHQQQQQQQREAEALLAAQAQQEQEHAATLQALWMQERRAAAAAAAAMAAAQQESEALEALRWGLATQHVSHSAFAGLFGPAGGGNGLMPGMHELAVGGPDALAAAGLAHQLSLLQMQRT